jgi:hypothetical protein
MEESETTRKRLHPFHRRYDVSDDVSFSEVESGDKSLPDRQLFLGERSGVNLKHPNIR